MSYTALLDKIRRCNLTLHRVLTPTNLAAARKQFLADKLATPNFVYGNLDIEQIQRNIQTLEVIADTLAGDHRCAENWGTAQICCQQALAQNQVAAVAYEIQQRRSQKAPIDAALMEKFNAGQAKLYGYPQKETFYELARWQKAQAGKSAKPVEPMSDELDGTTALERLVDDATLERFGKLVKARLQPYWEHIPKAQPKFTASEVVELINRALDQTVPFETDFRAVLAPELTPLNVDQLERRILVPEKRIFTPDELRTVVFGHEFGTHVLRGVPYEKRSYELSHGLPGYEEFEEGLAAAVEQALRRNLNLRGVDHYINIGLAYFCGYDFRQVYEFRLARLKQNMQTRAEKAQASATEVQQKCQKLAFIQTMRCFRGTGVLANFKDMIYYNGNLKAWQFIKPRLHQPERLMRQLFDSGKIDSSNALHQGVLKAVQGREFDW